MNAALMYAAIKLLQDPEEQCSTRCNAGHTPVVTKTYDSADAQQADANNAEEAPAAATLTMRDRYTTVTVRRIDERSYNINGYETDHCGTPYDAGDALDFIFKRYGTCTRHTITRP